MECQSPGANETQCALRGQTILASLEVARRNKGDKISKLKLRADDVLKDLTRKTDNWYLHGTCKVQALLAPSDTKADNQSRPPFQ